MAKWFYKDGVGKVFEDDKCPEGYSDHPKAKVTPKKKAKKKVK